MHNPTREGEREKADKKPRVSTASTEVLPIWRSEGVESILIHIQLPSSLIITFSEAQVP